MKHKNIAIFVPHAGCPHQCVFCNQNRISGAEAPPTPEEVDAILQSAYSSIADKQNAEIAFFGGSFTNIKREYMLSLLQVSQPYLGRKGFGGIRISTRPDGIDEEVLGLLERYGVTAIELGVQSMDDVVLCKNQRGHTSQQVQRAVQLIRMHSFSLGLQMMTGMLGSTPELDRKTAQEIISLHPDTVRVYPTVVMKGTALADCYLAGTYTPYKLDECVSLCAELLEQFDEAGVPVIRLGLHDSPSLNEDYLAGPYHPAFRELCESHLFYRKAAFLLRGIPHGDVTFKINAKNMSKFIGQKRNNIEKFKNIGYNVSLVIDNTLSHYECELESTGKEGCLCY